MKIKSDVTVIIPCYNDGKYIIEALSSILNQTVTVNKIIIVDDGSSQETRKILQSFSYPNLEIIYQDNQGVSAARNNAIKRATTDYIVNLDADDYYESTFIEKALNVFRQNESIVAVTSFCRSFDSHNQTIEILKPLGGVVKNFIIKNNGNGNAIFKKSSWEQVAGFDEKMIKGYEDWEFWISILQGNKRMEIIPEVLSHYRIKTTSRDKTALGKHDYELRKYIFLKHKEVYLEYLDFYTLEILRINAVLKNNVFKSKNALEFRIGFALLKPIRWVKRILK